MLIYSIYLVNCASVNNGEIGFCHCNTCSENEGDCDSHDECQNGLGCGSNNCLASLGFDSEVDCCYASAVGDEDFCASGIPCAEDEGDCDTHDECQDGLVCGSNNCPDSLGFNSEFDCCYYPSIGDEHFCTTDNPCAIDEGDCDSSNECKANLVCDTINSCPTHLGFASDVNCCSIGSKFF